MAANDELRLMFAGMDLTQKANFIANLEKSLEGSEDEEGMMFLDECKAHYTMELEAEAEIAADAAVEADVAAEPEIELGPEPAVDEAFEPEIELGPEPVVEDEIEPELLLEPDALLEAEVDAEPEVALEEELVPEIEVMLEEEPVLEPEVILEEEMVLEPEVVLEEEMVLEAEIEEELVAELEPEVALEMEPMLEVEIEAELEAEPVFEPEPEPLPVAKSRIDCIEMEISDLADSIRNKMGVIDTISHLLSGEGIEIVKSVAEAKGFEPAQPLESTSAYESKVDSIKESISEFADNILQDIRVMEAISNLLSGSDETGDTQSKKKSASASAK